MCEASSSRRDRLVGHHLPQRNPKLFDIRQELVGRIGALLRAGRGWLLREVATLPASQAVSNAKKTWVVTTHDTAGDLWCWRG